MKINVYPSRCYIEDKEYQLPQVILQYCQLSIPSFIKNKYTKRPERIIRHYNLYRQKDQSFPTGWLKQIVSLLREEGEYVEVVFSEKMNSKKHNSLIRQTFLHPELREYQTDAIDAVNAVSMPQSGLLCHPTGSGKTHLAAHLIYNFPYDTLYIVPSKNLLVQTYEKFSKWYSKDILGIYGAGCKVLAPITIATIQTVYKNIETNDELKFRFGNLIIDEVHHFSADPVKMMNVWLRTTQSIFAKHKFGLTATLPAIGSSDRKLLEAMIGPLIHYVDFNTLIDKGYLSPYEIHIYPFVHHQSYYDWPDTYQRGIVGNQERVNLLVSLVEKYTNDGKRVLLDINRVEEYGKNLHKLLDERGIVCSALFGETNMQDRIEQLNKIAKTKGYCIISSCLSEGIDIPELDCIILGSPSKLDMNVLQRLGRILRVSENKEKAILVDIKDIRGGFLTRHSSERYNLYKGLGCVIKLQKLDNREQ